MCGPRTGMIKGKAKKGTYDSPKFKCDDVHEKIDAINQLLKACESTVKPWELCVQVGMECEDGNLCMPSTLMSEIDSLLGGDDADLELHGPDDDGNCHYSLTVDGNGIVVWSTVDGSCKCVKDRYRHGEDSSLDTPYQQAI